MPAPRSSAEARRRRRSASGCAPASGHRSAGAMIRKLAVALRGPLADLVEKLLADHGLVRDHEHVLLARLARRCRRRRARPGRPPAASRMRSTTFLRSQPDFCSRMRRHDDLVDGRLELGQRVAHRGHRIGLDDEPVRRGSPPRAAPTACGRAGGRRRPGACPRRRRSHARGWVTGQITVTRRSLSPACAARPPRSACGRSTVSFATTRRCISCTCDLFVVAARSPFSTAWRAPGHAVLVRTADHLRDLVEVEHRRRRGHLPLERQRAPRVRRARARRAACSMTML